MAEANNDGVMLLFWFGFILNFAFYHLKTAREASTQFGSYWSKERSAYFKIETETGAYKLNNYNLYSIALRSTLLTAVMFPLYFMMKTAIEAGVSTAVINSIIGFTSFLSALMFWLAFNETLSKKHVIGMLFLLGSMTLISLSPQLEDKPIHQQSKSIWVPISLAILCCFIYSFSTLLAKFVIPRGEITN
jgi:drug/metabolite transporter (DMT)-like permease